MRAEVWRRLGWSIALSGIGVDLLNHHVLHLAPRDPTRSIAGAVALVGLVIAFLAGRKKSDPAPLR